MKKILTLLLAILIMVPASAATQRDSLGVSSSTPAFMRTRAWHITHASVPLIAAGAVFKNMDADIRSIRYGYIPDFRYKLDDYTQYLPAVVMLGMKTFGVESRSSWGRMLTADALSVFIQAAITNSVKYTALRLRPDGSDRHSYPSGHTATAFMAATMLSREYGYLSPWVSIGAYTVATGTGVMRMMNNKHWMSDVLTGAGIGILSTELGYLFSDLIFKDRGLNVADSYNTAYKYDRPTFISLYTGLSVPLSGLPEGSGSVWGSSIGCEGAYFFSHWIGAGASFIASHIPEGVKGISQEGLLATCSAGAYFSYPLGAHVQIGGKLLGGIMSEGQFTPTCGISMTFRADRLHSLRLFADWSGINGTCIMTLGACAAMNL